MSVRVVLKQYFMQPFLRSMKLLRYTHALTLKLWAEFLALMSVDHAWTCLKRTQLQYVICTVWTACPCLSWSAVAMRALTWVIFVPQASHRRCALVVPLHRWPITCTKLPEDVRASWNINFKCAYLKFTVYSHKRIHNFRMQCSHASVGLAQAGPKLWSACTYTFKYHRWGNFHIKNNLRKNFHGVTFLWFIRSANFFDGWQLQNGWAPGTFLVYSLLLALFPGLRWYWTLYFWGRQTWKSMLIDFVFLIC